MNRRNFVRAAVAGVAAVAGCNASSEPDSDPGPVQQADYTDRDAWPMAGRDAANSSFHDVPGPGDGASMGVLFDGADEPIYPVSGLNAGPPTVVGDGVYLPGGVVGRDDGTVDRTVDLNGDPGVPPAVAHGHSYRVSYEETAAFSLDDGERRWSADVLQPTLAVTPVVDDDHVYVASGWEEGGLVAIEAGSGDRRWTSENELGRITGLATAGGTVYVTETGDSRTSDGRVTALDPKTGVERWHQSVDRVLLSPAATENGVFVGTERGKLHAYDGSGLERWNRQVVSPQSGFLTSKPVLGDDRIFVPANNGSTTRALDRESGAVAWKQRTGLTFGAPAVGESNVYVPTVNNGLQALSRESGDVQWAIRAPSQPSGLALLEGELYFSAGGQVYVVA